MGAYISYRYADLLSVSVFLNDFLTTNKPTPPPARPPDLELAHWKQGISFLSASSADNKFE